MKKFNFFTLHAHAARSTMADPLQKYRFRITIPGLNNIGFQKISGLTDEVGVTEYDEGGFEYTHKLSGRPKVSELTCERGEYAGSLFQDKVKETLTNANMRQTVVVEKLDRTGRPARTYKLAEAWVSKWEGSDMDASSDDVAIEKITLQFEYYL